jgi:hypothetical protein
VLARRGGRTRPESESQSDDCGYDHHDDDCGDEHGAPSAIRQRWGGVIAAIDPSVHAKETTPRYA